MGLHLDVSSMNEARRARMAGIPYDRMMLTSQDVPIGSDRDELSMMMIQGLRYTVCSRQQLNNIMQVSGIENIPLAIRIHHGQGSGESESRNTAAPYASFGIVIDELPVLKKECIDRGLRFTCVHGHIGSGANPSVWQQHVDTMLQIAERFFPDAETLNLGGGFKVARMPGESEADLKALGYYAENAFLKFAQRTGRRLHMEVEPGSFIMANAGLLITRVLDIKFNPSNQWTFLITDGGIDVNVRPLLYGAQHPFALISQAGKLLWFDSQQAGTINSQPVVVAGRCCETGDCQTLDAAGRVQPRMMLSLIHI
jgi:diaminopimelate decarboxylase